ncbi:hypothetical protein ACHAQA_007855 [Verticillium albo-atrum]
MSTITAAIPEKLSHIPLVNALYRELNYAKGSDKYPEFRAETLGFVRAYRTRDGRPPKDPVVLNQPDLRSKEHVFQEMALTFLTKKRVNYFWPNDSTSQMFNGLRYSTEEGLAKILLSVLRLFYRMALNEYNYAKLKKDNGTNGSDSQGEDDYDHDTFIEPRARSSSAMSPDLASEKTSTSFQAINDFQVDATFEPINMGQYDTSVAQSLPNDLPIPNPPMPPPCDRVDPSQVFRPFDSTLPHRNIRSYQEGGETEGPPTKRIKEKDAQTSKRKTTFGKTRPNAPPSPEGVRCSSRNRTRRTRPGYVSETEADQRIQDAERSDSEPHQTGADGQPDQPSEQPVAQPVYVPADPEPIAPVAPMDMPKNDQPNATQPGQGQSSTRSRVKIATYAVLFTGKLHRRVVWEPEPSVPRMTLAQLEEQIPKVLKLAASGLMLKGLKLTLQTPQCTFEQDDCHGKDAHFGAWKQDCSRGIKKGMARLRDGEVLHVEIKVEAVVEGEEADSETDNAFGVENWA